MKARNPSTGTLDTVYVKALDSMPVGTQIEYTGDTIPTGWEEVNDYSTTEVDTGKRWIDGKKIYRKVITGSVSSNTSVATGVDTLVNFYGSATVFNTKRIVPYYEIYNNQSYGFTIQRQTNSNEWKTNILAQGSSTSASDCNIIVEYTKSS